MNSVPPEAEAAAIFMRVFESLARLNGKTLSASTRADITRACELLAQAAGDLDVLDDLGDPAPVRLSSGAVDDPGFARWRAARRFEEEERAG
jgi:hypothetical protein